MTITRNNFEPFVIDYLDGALSPEMTAELLLFLELNPDIASEVEGLQNEPIPSEDFFLFEGKEALRKSEKNEQLDELLFLVCEGLASNKQKAELQSILSLNPDMNKEFVAMQKARWTADLLVFENKSLLYKSESDLVLTGDMRLAALLEGDLNAKESAEVHNEINLDKATAASWSAMQKTKLIAPAIPFEAKDTLYRKQARVITLRRALYFSAAACALLFVTLFWNRDQEVSPVATNENIEVPTPKAPETPPNPQDEKPEANPAPQPLELAPTDPSLAINPNSSDKREKRKQTSPSVGNTQDIQKPDETEEYADNSGKISKLIKKNRGFEKSHRATGEVLPTSSKVTELPLPENTAQISRPAGETFPTILQFAEEKAREKILGDQPIEEATAFTLVERGLNRITGQENAKIERKNRGFHFKLGKFEVERN